jgi:hypothetical protein
MGLFAHLITYQVGKRRGKRKAQRAYSETKPDGNPKCVNYYSFCLNYGSCDGMECEYE